MWALIQHVLYDGSGGVAAALSRAGQRFVHVRPCQGDVLPSVGDLTGVIVLGGPSGAADDDVPHVIQERRLLAEAVGWGLPVLGVCFGAQLLAVALGGTVTRARTPEVGLDVVQLSAAGLDDPVLGPAGGELEVLQWHRDTYTLPPAAVHLASSARCVDQAFRFGSLVYGLQFHVEIDSTLAEVVRPQLPGLLDEEGVARASHCAAGVLDRFLCTALTAPHAPVPRQARKAAPGRCSPGR